MIIMAAHLGLPTHPGWFHNLLAAPDLTFGGEPFRASVEHDADTTERLWTAAERVFPPYARYRQDAATAGRMIHWCGSPHGPLIRPPRRRVVVGLRR